MSESIKDTFQGKVLEMVTDNPLINVPVSPNMNMDVITRDDPDPKFVNVEILRGNIVSGNGRRYSNNNVKELVGMIPGVQGFLGHPDPSKFGFEFREPQCIYVGAITEMLQDGTARAVGKAYLFKSSNLREWVPKSIAANNPMTVSINGSADIIRDGEYVDIVHFTELNSIDWANPGTEGVDTSKAMSVVNEMKNNNDNGGNNMEPKEILSNATVTEFKAYNPTGYLGIIKGITVSELRDNNSDVVKAIEEGARTTEMKITVGGNDKIVKLTEMQGIIDGLEKNVNDLNTQINTSKVTEYKSKKINEMIPDEKIREMVSKRVTGNTEAEIDASINSEIAYVREMYGIGPNDPLSNQPNINRGGNDVRDAVAQLFGTHKEQEKK